MEPVYQPENRPWISEKVSIKDFFSEFSKLLQKNYDLKVDKRTSAKRSTEQLMYRLMDVSLSNSEMKYLADTCSIDHLKVKEEPRKVNVKIVKARPALFDKSEIPESASHLETLKLLAKRQTNEEVIGNLKYRSGIWLKNEDQKYSYDLELGKHILITVRVYHPFRHNIGIRNNNPIRCSQELIFLGEQTLDVLKDKIICPADLTVRGELSENPDKNFTERAMDVYKSGFVFIDNVFYNDFRFENNKDYSKVIIDWASTHNVGPFQTAKLESKKFEDLAVMLGYPYVYMHQGNCEHLLVFSDIRFLHKNDLRSSSSYPLCRTIGSTNARYCMMCGFYVAKWITLGNLRVPIDPSFFCEHCFRSYNYIDKNKIGRFKAYPFYDKTAT